MGNLVKQTVTEITFMDSLSDEYDVRSFTLKYGSEGTGRYFELSDGKDTFYFHSPKDFKKLYKASKKLWKQGHIHAKAKGW